MEKLQLLLNEEESKMKKIDYIIISVIIVLYSILSFINLGSISNPQTFHHFKENEQIICSFNNKVNIENVKFYNGDVNGEYAIYESVDNKKYNHITTITGNGAFSWNEESLSINTKHIKIVPVINDSSLGEIAFYNSDNEKIDIIKVTSSTTSIKKLTDEESKIPKVISYKNSSYFDEIYFARTAYNYKEKTEAYEWVHPPLGKMLQALPVILFDTMAPFFYRLMGNIAGIAMIYIMYLFGKQLFKKRKWAIFASLLMFFDTFHFAHTRMGTIDSFLVLFIMISLYFMYRYITKTDTRYDLILSGVFFGLSVCVKWIGLLGGLSLAIIYFIDLYKNKKNVIRTIIKGTTYFVVIPLLLYITIYLVYPNNQVTYTDSIKDIFIQTKAVFEYHSQLEEPHFFSSKWYSWPIAYKPVWYYTKEISNSVHGTITGIGNIFIWWLGFLTIPYLIYKTVRKKDFNSVFILISVLSLWLPYIFIGRVMFLYHYFPVVPFIMLSLTMLFHDIEYKTTKKYITYVYLIFVVIFFIAYYPVVSGLPTSNEYIEKLKILPTWYF